MNQAIQKPTHGFELRPLPLSLRVAGGVIAAVSRRAWALEPELLLRAAGRAARLEPRVPARTELALDRLCRSLTDEADLHWFGRANHWEFIVTGLATWLRLDHLFRSQPELAETPLIPPLIVTGLPRSGTTFLHRLLCDAPDARAIPFYEHVYPVPSARRLFDGRRLDVEAKFVPWRMVARRYGMDAIHYVRPNEADECNFSLRLGMRSMLFWSTAPISDYLYWLLDQDLTEDYRDYRRILQLLQRSSPGRRLTLKCPSHAAFLPALCEAIPEARLVITHRDPQILAGSESSLVLALQATSTRSFDWRRSVGCNLDKVTAYAERLVAFADSDRADRAHHVDYRRLLTEPLEVAREIRTGFGLGFEAEHEQRLHGYARRNPQHKHGRHRYSLEGFEIDPRDLDRRFAGYRERFAAYLSS